MEENSKAPPSGNRGRGTRIFAPLPDREQVTIVEVSRFHAVSKTSESEI
jgi:hypothetical protein